MILLAERPRFTLEDRRAWSIRHVYEDRGEDFLKGFEMIVQTSHFIRHMIQVLPGVTIQSHLSAIGKEHVEELLLPAEAHFEKMGARATKDAIRRVIDQLDDHFILIRDADVLVLNLKGVYWDEMKSWHVIILNQLEAAIFDHGETETFGQEVVDAFPSALMNMSEACKCFVLERWTACTYHCMGVVEAGIKALCKEVIPAFNLDSYDVTWDKMRKAIEAELHPFRDPSYPGGNSPARRKLSHPATWDEDEVFFFGCIDDIKAIARAYRNPSMHFRTIFDSDERQAKRVLDSTAGFMQDVAMRIREWA